MKRVSYSGLCSGLAASYHPVIALNPGSARERKVGHLLRLTVFQRDCAVKIREEDDLGLRFQSLWERHRGGLCCDCDEDCDNWSVF